MAVKIIRLFSCIAVGKTISFFLLLAAAAGCYGQNREPVTLKNLDQVIDGLESSFLARRHESIDKFLMVSETDLVSFKSNPRFKRTLTSLLKDENHVIQLFSASVLARTGEFSKELRDFYLVKFESDDFWVRTQVCGGVAQNEELLKRSEDIMEKALQDVHWSVVQQAAFSLADYRDLDNEAIIKLLIVRIDNDLYPIIQKYCMRSLKNVTDKHVNFVLRKIYEIKDEIQKKSGKESDLFKETKATIDSLEKRVKEK